jgi:transcriptional regulator with PAS, ATPase and Fis domain
MFEQAADTVSGQARYQGFSIETNGESQVRHSALRGIITRDGQMERIFQIAEKVAETTSTVLILGESGTGKELIARAVHELSGCRGHFVPVNCGAIPDNLLESELFGHEKGAFTGAVMSKPGRFVLADGGTIFLDEIGEMSPHLQVKLLRVLQDKVVESVGGLKPRNVNVRVIAATNVNLAEQVREGKFREDLFYRLQVVPITLPSLRERAADIPALVNYFSKKFADANDRRPLVFSDEVLQAFMRYAWPGNVRELENFIERLSILVDSNAIYLSDLPPHILQGGKSSLQSGLSLSLPETGLDFNQVVEQFENTLILQALERTQGNKKAAARLLNLNRTTLVEKIKKKGLERDDEEGMEQ